MHHDNVKMMSQVYNIHKIVPHLYKLKLLAHKSATELNMYKSAFALKVVIFQQSCLLFLHVQPASMHLTNAGQIDPLPKHNSFGTFPPEI
jgi:hypothetical protein